MKAYRVYYNFDQKKWERDSAPTKSHNQISTPTIMEFFMFPLNCAEETVNELNNGITKICRDCHCVFTLTNKEAGDYKSRGWKLPTRCSGCRKIRRNTN